MSENLNPNGGGRSATSPTNDDELPQRNPFRSKTWNLTGQMQLLRDDPKKARRLKAEAEADGESAGPSANPFGLRWR